MEWLVEQNLWDAIENYTHDESKVTTEILARLDSIGGDPGSYIINPSSSSSIARIPVNGVLVESPSLMAMLMGKRQTSYASIIGGIQAANKDESIEKIILDIDSPGGNVNGLFSALDAIKASEKPVEAYVTGTAASAAYSVAAMTDKIIAANQGSQFGSVGVVLISKISNQTVAVTNTDSPDKFPDAKTEEGQKVMQAEADERFELFAQYIADGRGVSIDTVKNEFGKGRTFLSQNALKRGMIDSIATDTTSISGSSKPVAAATQQKEVQAMTLDELQRENRDVYAAAVAVGVEQERDRVSAHLTYGQTAGAVDLAISAIKDGKGITESIKAEYFAAQANNNDIKNRQEDSDDAEGVVDGAEASSDAERLEKEVLAGLAGE